MLITNDYLKASRYIIPRNRNNDKLTNRRKQATREERRKRKKETISGAHIPLGIPKVSEKKEGIKRKKKEITPQ